MDSTPIYLKMDNINFNTFREVVRRMGEVCLKIG